MRTKRKMEETIVTPILKLLPYIPILFTFFICYHSHPTRAQAFVYATCSQEKYQPNTQYETNLNSLLSSVVSASSLTLYDSFAIGNDSSTSQDRVVYGLFQCRGDLRSQDCTTCIASLIDRIDLACPYAYSGSLQLDRCLLRYENANFLGIADTSLMYKRCSNSLTSDYEVRRRDIVLDNLQGADGFRVSIAGPVDGYAQCLGDLSRSDCATCLSEAVAQVKSLCGSSAAGDVYLAQCYIRYWVTGNYDHAPLDSANHDDGVGKAVAILVGAIAGVAILIVLLSLCKTSIARK